MDAHPIGRRERHLLDRAARGHRDADVRGQAGVEALPRLEDRARFAILGLRDQTRGEIILIGFVGNGDAGIGTGSVRRMRRRSGKARQRAGADNEAKMKLLRQRSVSHVSTPQSLSPVPFLKGRWCRMLCSDGNLSLPVSVDDGPSLTKQ